MTVSDKLPILWTVYTVELVHKKKLQFEEADL